VHFVLGKLFSVAKQLTLRVNHQKQYEELHGNDDNQAVVNNFVQSSGFKILLLELTNGMIEFVTRDLRLVSVLDGPGYFVILPLSSGCR